MQKPLSTVNIHFIKLNTFDHGSSLSTGGSLIVGKHIFAKKNQGFGQQFADGSVHVLPISSTWDADLIDKQVTKNSI